MKKLLISFAMLMIISIVFVPVASARDGTSGVNHQLSVEKAIVTPVKVERQYKPDVKAISTIFTETKKNFANSLTASNAGFTTFDGYWKPPEKIPICNQWLANSTNRIREPTV